MKKKKIWKQTYVWKIGLLGVFLLVSGFLYSCRNESEELVLSGNAGSAIEEFEADNSTGVANENLAAGNAETKVRELTVVLDEGSDDSFGGSGNVDEASGKGQKDASGFISSVSNGISKERESKTASDTNHGNPAETSLVDTEKTVPVGNEELADGVTAYIYGCVRVPGVYTLPQGSRLYELIAAAGGFTKKAKQDARNQAERLLDGESYRIISKASWKKQIRLEKKLNTTRQDKSVDFLPEQQEGVAGTNGQASQDSGGNAAVNHGTSESRESSKVNLNTAGQQELMTLSGIGQSKADAIIAYRQQQGAFSSIEDIMNISGIKQGVFDQIKDRITVEEN